MPNTFFTADTHFGHKNILKFQPNRACTSIEEMNEKIVDAWNSRVQHLDTIWFLGDFSFLNQKKTYEILKQLNGIKHLVRGNHDAALDCEMNRAFFHTAQDYKRLKLGGKRLILFHYPISTWDSCHHGSYHLHGHSHGGHNGKGRILDVGVDTREDMAPYAFEEVVELLENKPLVEHCHSGDTL